MKRSNPIVAGAIAIVILGLLSWAWWISEKQQNEALRKYAASTATLTTTSMPPLTLAGPREVIIDTERGKIQIDCRTGEVHLPDGMEPSEASRQFWKALEQAFPQAKPEPTKTPMDSDVRREPKAGDVAVGALADGSLVYRTPPVDELRARLDRIEHILTYNQITAPPK